MVDMTSIFSKWTPLHTYGNLASLVAPRFPPSLAGWYLFKRWGQKKKSGKRQKGRIRLFCAGQPTFRVGCPDIDVADQGDGVLKP